MGYHGFGMRKEVYARKPKKAFDKIKKYNTRNPYGSPKKRDDREVYIHTYHKPAYKRWWFRILALALLGYFTYIYITDYMIPQRKIEQQKEALKQQIDLFEKEGIFDYFIENKSVADSAYALMQKSDRTLIQIGTEYQSSFIRIQSRRKIKGRSRNNRKITIETMNDFYVEDDLLMYSKPTDRKIANRGWKLRIDTQDATDIPITFLNHIKLKKSDFMPLLKRTRDKKWIFEQVSGGFKWRFNKYDSHYSFYFTNNPNLLEDVYIRNLKLLSPGVYWIHDY